MRSYSTSETALHLRSIGPNVQLHIGPNVQQTD
jgi:hypothetical protein